MALTSTTTSGGENPRPSLPGAFLEPGQAFFEEALPPLGDDLASRVEAQGDLVVVDALSREEHDLGPDNVSIRQRIPPGLRLQDLALFWRQLDRERASSRQDDPRGTGSSYTTRA